MTRTRYSLAVLLQSFGLVRKTKRLTDIAFEMHLLQDGEELLGSSCWANTEEIEEVSMEYWTLRRLEREQATIMKSLEESEETLGNAQMNRASFVGRSKEEGEELLQNREELFLEIEELNTSHATIMTEAQATKRKHGALKMKAKVLTEEGNQNPEKIRDCRTALAELKEKFGSTRERLTSLEQEIAARNLELTELQSRIDQSLKGTKGEAREGFTHISQANRDITKFQMELGLLREEHSKHCRDIGRFLSINELRPDCRQACKDSKGLLQQLRILRQSVNLNRRLVERVTPN